MKDKVLKQDGQASMKTKGFFVQDKKVVYYLITVPLFFLAGFLSTNCVLFGTISPFCAALVAACPLFGSVFAVAGILFSSVIGFSLIKMQYILASVIILTVKWAFAPSAKIRSNPYFITTIAFVIPFLFSLIFSGYGVIKFANILKAFAEGAVSSSITYFFYKVINIAEKEKPLPLLKHEKISALILAGIIGAALSGVYVFNVSVGHILISAVILCCISVGKETGGCVSGVVGGIVISLTNPINLFYTAAFGFSGLISGLFASFGKIAVSAIFIVTNFIVISLTQPIDITLIAILEILIGTLLFNFIPKKVMTKIFSNVVTIESTVPEETQGVFKTLGMRLGFASKAYGDISSTIEKVTKELDNITVNKNNLAEVFIKASDFTCANCKRRNVCWQKQYNDTMDSFNNAIYMLKTKGRISIKDFDSKLITTCPNTEKIAEVVNFIYKEFYLKNMAQERLQYIKQAYIEQFSAMSAAMCEMSDEISILENYDKKGTKKLEKLLKSYCEKFFEVGVTTDKYSRVFIDFVVSEVDFNNLTDEFFNQIDLMFERKFAKPSVVNCSESVKVSLFEKANLSVDSACVQFQFDNEKYCGDTTDSFSSSDGKMFFVLSDGMGKGVNAAVDSVMTSSLFSKLIRANFQPQSALKTINSVMIAKSDEESLATLDVTRVDVYTGKVTFFKAGAAQTFVIKKGRIITMEGKSAPAGILHGAQFDEDEIKLSAGDIIVMVSDGIVGDNYDWVLKLLEKIKTRSCQDIANSVATYAKKILNNPDDITVYAIKIEKGV